MNNYIGKKGYTIKNDLTQNQLYNLRNELLLNPIII